MLLSYEPSAKISGMEKGYIDSASAFHQALFNIANTISLKSVAELLDRCNLIQIVAILRIRFLRTKSNYLRHSILTGILEVIANLPPVTPFPVIRLIMLFLNDAFCECRCFGGRVIDGMLLVLSHVETTLNNGNLYNNDLVAQLLFPDLLIIMAKLSTKSCSFKERPCDSELLFLSDPQLCLHNSHAFDADERLNSIDKLRDYITNRFAKLVNKCGNSYLLCPTILFEMIRQTFPEVLKLEIMPPSDQPGSAIKVEF